MAEKYLIGQRVIVFGTHICQVTTSSIHPTPPNTVWVILPSGGNPVAVSRPSVKPLPGGQL